MEKAETSKLRRENVLSFGVDNPSNSVLQSAAIAPWRFWLLCVGVCLGLFLSMVDSSIVATSLYTIGSEFHTVDSVNWVALAYTLAYLGCAVTFARFSDVVGRRNAFIVAFIIFFAFSLACGFSQNLPQLIGFRALQGIGGSGLFGFKKVVEKFIANGQDVGLYSLSMIILPELCPVDLRQYIGSVIGLVVAGSGVLGPVLGGIFTHYASWRWVFWVNGPIGFISLSIFVITWPKPNQLPPIERRSWKEFDFVGSFLVIASSVLVVFAFQNAGEAPGNVWRDAVFIAPLVTGLVGWVVLLTWEYMAESRLQGHFLPTFPIGLFYNRAYSAGAASTLFLGYPYLLIIYSFPLRAQVVGGRTSLTAGLMLLPMLGASAVGSAISGKVNAKRNLLCETLFVGACLMTIGCGLLTTVSQKSDDSKALGFLTFTGLGFGLSTAAATILVAVEAPVRDHAPAQGILAQMRVLGGSLGISTSTIFVHMEASRHLAGILSSQDRATLGRTGTRLSSEQWDLVRVSYSEAFKKGMIAAAAISGAAVILTVGGYRHERRPLHGHPKALVQTSQLPGEQQNSLTEPDSLEHA